MILLKNDKVAKFLGMALPQMHKMMQKGCLNIGVFGKANINYRHYVYKDMLEKVIGRELTENELDEMRK